MKCTPFLSAVVLGAAVATALQPLDARFPSGGADGPKPTGSMQGGAGGAAGHSHHGHHHSFTGHHQHMSGTFTVTGDEPLPTEGVKQKQKRGHARGGNHQSDSGEHTSGGGDHFPSGVSSSRKGHHTGAGDGHFTGIHPFTLVEGAQPTGAMVRARDGGRGGHRSHGGAHQTTSQGHQTVTRVSQVHIPTTFTKMVTANGH